MILYDNINNTVGCRRYSFTLISVLLWNA